MQRLKNNCCYLIGPIDRVIDGGQSWRKEITPFLHNLGIGVFDPTNKPISTSEGKNYTVDINNLKQTSQYNEARVRMAETVTTDLHLLDLSNFVIAFIDTSIHMCGSYSEITYAALEKKPVIIVCKQGKSEVPNWLFGMGLRHEMFFDSFDQAKKYIKHIHEDSIVNTLNRWRFIDYPIVYGDKYE